ncbi:peptidoglycan-binding protein [Alicyclobacillus sp.]|uniref:L,D-transpeptidase family protein n=1 Tax=Alicyclobacillus sp. TaxID=61169 RepID=UPI0025B9984C|nr:peptidoglycan-binding protein [Alicyclobacillus sp.]MCL6516264.1 peptidoglycan-binding protein [Alicyclobacillus sp.]
MRRFVRSCVLALLATLMLGVSACTPSGTAQPTTLKPLPNSVTGSDAYAQPGIAVPPPSGGKPSDAVTPDRPGDSRTVPDAGSGSATAGTDNPSVEVPLSALPTLQQGDSGPAVTRLQQLLGELGYLPLGFQPDGEEPGTLNAQRRAVLSPPSGTWKVSYPNTPSALTDLWAAGQFNTLVRGAVMTFQEAKGLETDGVVGPKTWAALLTDALAKRANPFGYTFVTVNTRVPQTLTVWWNGKTVLTSPANTGIAQSPTVHGTFPVYLRYRSQTMSGVTPWGERYSDPGVPYVSYFYGGEAVHGFERASYGTPQSLGCVELPVANAAVAWKYMHYGTLVQIR